MRVGAFLAAFLVAFAAHAAYDPLAASNAADAPKDWVFHDARRDRDVPLRVFLPAARTPQPVVLFSHGLGGSREGNAFMGEHWAARGYVAVFVQHPGSDTSVWSDVPKEKRHAEMKRAASVKNLRLRTGDIAFVLDELARRAGDGASPLAGRMDLTRVGMSGHSFGAITTQAVSGEELPMGLAKYDPRIKAAIAFSPSGPRMGQTKRAFGSVPIPWMLMTGTEDRSPIGAIDSASRLEVFPGLPPGGKYELVLDRAEHSAFTDRALPGDREARNPNHHRAVLALSTAFWDAYLKDDAAAKAWLDGEGPRGVLESKDRWQHK